MYLLDTNILSELLKRDPHPGVTNHFEAAPAGALYTSVICIEEIGFGVRIAPPGNRIWERFEALVLPRVVTLDLDLDSALASGELRAEAYRQGLPSSYADSLIAGAAKAHGLTLVTRNTRHFEHFSGLRVENWFELPPPAA